MIKKIGIGTAQWGSAYGISNRNGKVINKEISNILSIAQSRGVKIIDTAPTYGNAEKSLSEQNLHAFNIVTKIPKFSKSEITVNDIIKLNSRIEHFLSLLGASQIYGILVHDGSDIMAKGGEYICDTLCDLKERGLVKKIGVSIYDSKNLDNICTRLKPDIIQLPINVLDQRLIKDGTLKRLKNRDIEIHARSIFLQGLLLMSPSLIPSYFKPWTDILNNWHKACHDQNFNFFQAALNFVIGIKEIDYCILGFENSTQISECIDSLDDKRIFDAKNIECSDVNLINPTNWRLD